MYLLVLHLSSNIRSFLCVARGETVLVEPHIPLGVSLYRYRDRVSRSVPTLRDWKDELLSLSVTNSMVIPYDPRRTFVRSPRIGSYVPCRGQKGPADVSAHPSPHRPLHATAGPSATNVVPRSAVHLTDLSNVCSPVTPLYLREQIERMFARSLSAANVPRCSHRLA